MARKKRVYKKGAKGSEYKKQGPGSKQIKNRAKRNKARRKAIREGRAKKGDGKEVDHIKPLSRGGSNSSKNTRVVSRKTNRKKQPKRKRGRPRKKK